MKRTHDQKYATDRAEYNRKKDLPDVAMETDRCEMLDRQFIFSKKK